MESFERHGDIIIKSPFTFICSLCKSMEVCIVIHGGLFKAKFHVVNLAKSRICWYTLEVSGFFLPEWKLKISEFITFNENLSPSSI